MARRKVQMKYDSWESAERAAIQGEKATQAFSLALREVLEDRVQWLSGDLSVRRIGLCLLEDSCGGVVIIRFRRVLGARFLEDWLKEVDSMPAPLDKREYMPDYREWSDVRSLAQRARGIQRIAQEKSAQCGTSCSGGGISGIVDQDVRTY